MRCALLAILLIACGSCVVRAQEAGGHKLESLDELLGLAPPGTGSDEGAHVLPDPLRAELDRELSQQEAAQAFEQAATLMGETAMRLADAGDTGLATQRLQEDIIRKLDAVIEAAQRNQQQQNSSSSSQQQQNQQQPSQPQEQQQAQNPQGDNRDENMPPSRRDGPLRPEIESARAAWGALPQRVRDSLMQGLSDRYSSLYERLTETYYRRLAEDRDQ
ncbi:MAG: hypothetical protein R3B57_02795 [Phycisphaerales bacterium]